jgi:hypothetical protein
VTAIAAAILLCAFLAFLPGRYDSAARALSMMAQTVGVAGLLLVPIGALALAFGWRGGFAIFLRWAALVSMAIVVLAASVAAMAHNATSLGVVTLVLGACGVVWFSRALKRTEGSAIERSSAIYLLATPIVVAVAVFAFLGAARDYARHRAIQNSAEVIRDIEAYRRAHGVYPDSLHAVNQDYSPGVVGIERYFYEPRGEAFSLFFETPGSLLRLGTREIVMFNPIDGHRSLSHDGDILLWTPEQVEERRGWYAVHDAGEPHWKYFLFD